MCESREFQNLMKEASGLFQKQMRNYYSPKDLKSRTTLAFTKGKGENIKVGLMKLVSVVADKRLPVKRGDLILNMARVCDALEGSGEDMMIMNKDMICTD
jgi:hypothetical protein